MNSKTFVMMLALATPILANAISNGKYPQNPQRWAQVDPLAYNGQNWENTYYYSCENNDSAYKKKVTMKVISPTEKGISGGGDILMAMKDTRSEKTIAYVGTVSKWQDSVTFNFLSEESTLAAGDNDYSQSFTVSSEVLDGAKTVQVVGRGNRMANDDLSCTRLKKTSSR